MIWHRRWFQKTPPTCEAHEWLYTHQLTSLNKFQHYMPIRNSQRTCWHYFWWLFNKWKITKDDNRDKNVWWYRRNDDGQNGKRDLSIRLAGKSEEKVNKWRHVIMGTEIIKTNKTMIFTQNNLFFVYKEKFGHFWIFFSSFACKHAAIRQHSCS